MTQSAGWYEDPNNPTLMRYHDGVEWTAHTTPRVKPGLDESRISQPRPVQPPAPPYPGQAPQQGQYPQPPQTTSSYPWPGQSAQGQQPYPAAYPQQGWMPGQPGGRDVASNGRVRAGWWSRVGAYLLDSILLWIVTLPFIGVITAPVQDELVTWFEDLITASESTSAVMPAVPGEVMRALVVAGLVSALAWLLYETIGLARWGRTLGRMAAGIAVQREGQLPPQGQPVPMAAGIGFGPALVRSAVKLIHSFLRNVPGVSLVTSIFALLDVLWPLWDGRRRAIHDMPAKTEVIRTR